MENEDTKFGSKWLQRDVILLGGTWAYVVGIIADINSGDRKIRIAKGKVKGKVHWHEGHLKATFDKDEDPITQVNRLNLKTRSEWTQIKALCDKYFEVLEQGNVVKK